LRKFPGLQAAGVAGMTRSLTPEKMERELRPALKKLKALGAPHVHYKVCSTFDSSPRIGSIGRVINLGVEIFRSPFVPLLVAAPMLGRYTVFGNHFARFGIGSEGGIHRLDRHPSISHHPITPMAEADLRLHLAKQTKKKIALFDILKLALPEQEARAALQAMLADKTNDVAAADVRRRTGKPEVILFDALYAEQLPRIGALIDGYASVKRPLFSVGSSGIEMALAAYWRQAGRVRSNVTPAQRAGPASQFLVGSGSCSPVTQKQIAWALKNGFSEVALNVPALTSPKTRKREIERAAAAAAKYMRAGSSVIVHTTRTGSDRLNSAKLKHNSAMILGTALGQVLREALAQHQVQRLCVAGGDTSSFAARALGIEALAMKAPLTPGAPLCPAFATGSPADGLEVVFKGGQVGPENYFGIVKRGQT